MPSFGETSAADYVPEPNFSAPDLIEAVEGWRCWGVSADPLPYGVAPKLTSVTFGGYYWAPRKTSLASCPSCGDDVPRQSCSCGFYSAKDLDHLRTLGYHAGLARSAGKFCVIGQVANWGKVIEGSQGWRAARAYPTRLFVPYEAWRLVEPLSEAYGIPVELQNVLDFEFKS